MCGVGGTLESLDIILEKFLFMFWIKFRLLILLCLERDSYTVIKISRTGDWERLTFMFVVRAGGGGLLDLPDDISHSSVLSPVCALCSDTSLAWCLCPNLNMRLRSNLVVHLS